MNVFALLFVFSCGVSLGILIGRYDTRKKLGSAETPAVIERVVLAPPPATAPPSAAPAAVGANVPDGGQEPPARSATPEVPEPPEPPEPEPLEPAVVKAIVDPELLTPLPKPPPVITKRGRKAGIDESKLTVNDDILERLRRAEELGVSADQVQAMLASTPPPEAPVARPVDPALAEAERRVLERLRRQTEHEEGQA